MEKPAITPMSNEVGTTGGVRVDASVLLDADNSKAPSSGTVDLRVFYVNGTSAISQLDFSDNTFKTSGHTTKTKSMSHQAIDGYDTGIWTADIPIAAFEEGFVYLFEVTPSAASTLSVAKYEHFNYSADALTWLDRQRLNEWHKDGVMVGSFHDPDWSDGMGQTLPNGFGANFAQFFYNAGNSSSFGIAELEETATNVSDTKVFANDMFTDGVDVKSLSGQSLADGFIVNNFMVFFGNSGAVYNGAIDDVTETKLHASNTYAYVDFMQQHGVKVRSLQDVVLTGTAAANFNTFFNNGSVASVNKVDSLNVNVESVNGDDLEGSAGTNFNTFFYNNGASGTPNTVDDVGGLWTAAQIAEVMDYLG